MVGQGDPNDREFGPACVERITPGDTESQFPLSDADPLAREVAACAQKTGAPGPELYYAVSMAYCDDSGDCPEGELCFFVGHHGSWLGDICADAVNVKYDLTESCVRGGPPCHEGTVCSLTPGRDAGLCQSP